MFLYHNNNNNATNSNNHELKKVDEMLQIGLGIQNNQIESMEILHMLHTMQEKVIKLLTSKFDKFEKLMYEMHENGKKDIVNELLLVMVSDLCHTFLRFMCQVELCIGWGKNSRKNQNDRIEPNQQNVRFISN